MCGIAGIYCFQPIIDDKELLVAKMNQSMYHRGPDDEGIFADQNIALGHRRLSIIDLSPFGHQPMANHDNRYHIVFNGEIYNFEEVKAQIQDYPFQSQSDTEVILAAYMKWGKYCLDKFNGMFAFAIWDKEKEELFIARDRFGKKPLYYYRNNNYFIFASELRALLNSDKVPRKIDSLGAQDFLRYYTVQSPHTIIKDVYMLLPGHYMLITNEQFKISKYWDLIENVSMASKGKKYKEVCDDIHFLLTESVKRRLISDVPLGAFLSGGIDSSIIVGLMATQITKKVKTFSVTFHENKFNESVYSRIIADKFSTEHHEIKLSANDLLTLLPSALADIDHPTTDGINSYVVAKVTKQEGITVALSGLGGDELFAGYDIIFGRLQKIQKYKWLWHIPVAMRKILATLINVISPSVASYKIGYALMKPSSSLTDVYPILRQGLLNNQMEEILKVDFFESDRNSVSDILMTMKNLSNLPFLSQVSVAELIFFLQSILLRDIDQMSMAHSLEVRAPFLDYELVEYVLGVRDNYKQPITPKKLLVDSVGNLLPVAIVSRPKMGFFFPWEIWMKGELKKFCEEHINSFSNRPFSNNGAVLDMWKRFLNGDKRVNYMRIWTLVTLESWLTKNKISI